MIMAKGASRLGAQEQEARKRIQRHFPIDMFREMTCSILLTLDTWVAA